MKRIYAKGEVCIGCHLCEVYCRLAHSPTNDLVKAFNRESTPPLACVRVEESKPISFALQCRHCDEPVCVYSCLSGALRKDPETGVVTVDNEKCIGCWTCVLACPVAAPRRDTSQGKVIKCDLCQGREMPLCVMNCPNEALVYGEAPASK
jgi:carbon-monoxide dehydrogenase iron sulfur subunit